MDSPSKTPVRGAVLVVDDEVDLADSLVRLLKSKGWDAHSASSPLGALEILSQSPGRFAVVLSDLDMPGMDGCAFLDQVKILGPRISTVLISGHEQPLNAPQVDAFLAKPFKPQELWALVEGLAGNQ